MSGRWAWRDSVEYAAFRTVATIATALPLETASDLSAWIWRNVAAVRDTKEGQICGDVSPMPAAA